VRVNRGAIFRLGWVARRGTSPLGWWQAARHHPAEDSTLLGWTPFYLYISCHSGSFLALVKTGMCYRLASDHQVTSINHPDSLGALGQLDSPLTLLFALYDAVQAHSAIRGIDINI
jgi:hypothetical protein